MLGSRCGFGGGISVRMSGELLRELRVQRFMTQQELADAAGTTEATVNRLEKDLQTARISTVRKLAAALDVTPDRLMAKEKRAQDSS